MGLFSRKDKAPKGNSSIAASQSTASIGSGNSRVIGNRVSAGSFTSGGTPLSPMSPVKLPKVDLPRPPDPQLDPVGYLRSLGAVRDRSQLILDKAKRNKLNHFDVDFSKFTNVVTFVSGLIKVFAPLLGASPNYLLSIPSHTFRDWSLDDRSAALYPRTCGEARTNKHDSATTKPHLPISPGMDDTSIFASAAGTVLRN
jgi:hypothetical protein